MQDMPFRGVPAWAARAYLDPMADLASSWAMILARPFLIIACVSLALLGAAAFLVFTPPLYEATALISIDPKSDGSLARRQVVSDANVDSAIVETEVEILRSPHVARAVVEAEGLVNDPYFVRRGRLRKMTMEAIASLEPHLTGDLGSAVRWLFPAPTRASEAAYEERAVEVLQRLIKIKRINLTYVVSVTADLPDPQSAARIANAYANAYIASRRAAHRAAARQASELLNERAIELQSRVSESELAVEGLRAGGNAAGADAASSKVMLRNRESSARAYRALYEKVLETYVEASEVGSAASSRAHIVSQATAPLSKHWPSTTLVIAAALAIGFSAGALIALVRGSPSRSGR